MTRGEHRIAEPELRILEEFPTRSTFDVVVVGGGPNGLIAAAYLSRAGLRVALVERRQEIGGGLSTEETLFPGYYTNPHAFYHMMTDYLPVLSDFDLRVHGLYFVKPNAQAAALFPDGTSLLLCHQLEDTKDSLATVSPADAAAFGRVMRTWRRIVDDLLAPGTYLPALSPIDMIEAMERTDVGREALRLTELSPIEIVDETFDDDRVRALMLYVSCMWGLDPRESGLGFMVPLMIDRAMNKAQCYGGSHKLAGALSREIHKAGGIVLDNAEVTRIIVEHGAVTGVECFDGRVLEAKAVLSSLAPPITFGKLIDPVAVPAELTEAATHWEWDKWSFFTLSLATDTAPRYRADDPWVDDALMVLLGFGTTDDVLAHYDAVATGQLGSVLGGHATVETRYDPTLTRLPGHQVSFLQMHAPYDVDGGWDAAGPDVTAELLALWRRHCDGVEPEHVLRQSVESPVDIETRLTSMVRGSIKHGDYNPLQMGSFRPNASCVAGRSPIEGLYLCGSSSYPGGLVIGGPGYIAAGSVVEDLAAERWWRTPRFMARYQEQYLS